MHVSLPTPLEHQVQILTSPARFKLVNCGRRWGKTGMGHIATVRGHGAARGHLKGLIDGARIWWVAPTTTTIKNSQIWAQLKRSLRDSWTEKSEVYHSIDLENGGSVAVRSADDPDSLRGPGLDGVVIDEAAFVKEQVWENALRPALADREGWAIIQSTPNGKNWFYKRHLAALRGRGGWEAWTSPTAANPLVTDLELEEIKQDIGPRRFAQGPAAQFMDVEGALWPAAYFEDRIWADEIPSQYDICAMGVDPAQSKQSSADFSAVVFVGLSGRTLWVDAVIERLSPGELIEVIARMHDRYRPLGIGVESIAFQRLYCDLLDSWCQVRRRPPLPVFAISDHAAKDIRVQRLDSYLAGDKFRFRRSPGCDLLVEQTMMFPNKIAHDDGPDALEMAVRMLTHFLNRQDAMTPESEFEDTEV